MNNEIVDNRKNGDYTPPISSRAGNSSLPRNSLITGYVGGKTRKTYSDEKLHMGCSCSCKCPDHLEVTTGSINSTIGGYIIGAFFCPE